MKHGLLLSLSLLLTLGPVAALAQIAEKWTANTGPVNWLRTTSAGALVASTPTGLHGIDTETGAVSWTMEGLAGAPEAGYEELARTPFIAVVPADHPDQLYVIEPFSGHVAFNSSTAGVGHITGKYVLSENNAMIVEGKRTDGTPTLACVDLATGKLRWTKDDSFGKLTACNSAGADALLLSTLMYAYKLDANTGAELWKKCPDPGLEKLAGLFANMSKGDLNLPGMGEVQGVFITTDHAPGLCLMGMQSVQQKETKDSQGKSITTTTYHTFVNAFRIADGSYAWPAPLELPQKMGALIPTERGLIVGTADANKVYLMDYASGQGLWGKKGRGIGVKGNLNGAVPLGEHALLTSGGRNGAVMLVDAAGEDLWKKPLKISGEVVKVTLLEDAVLVASAEEVDVVDLSTGTSKLPNPLQGGAGTVAVGTQRTFVFNTKDGLLYSMPNGGGTLTAMSTTPVKFEGKEDATHLECVPGGIVVSSDQNVALISEAGQVQYSKYFPAGRESGLNRALKYASAVRAAYYTAAFGYTSAAFGAASQGIEVRDAGSAATREVTSAISDVYGDAANSGLEATKRFLKEANERLKATTATNEVQFMMTDAGKREYQLVALKKADGSVIGTIPLGQDKEPAYEVDGFDNTVYLVDGDAVKAYTL